MNINGNYLFRAFNSSGIDDQFKISANGITRYAVGKDAISNAFFPVPPLKEQIQIATYLDKKTKTIDTLISKQQTLIELLKEKRQALVDKAINESDIKEVRLDRVITQIYRPMHRDKNKIYTTLGLYNRGRGLFHRDPKEEEELGQSDFY